MIRKMDGFSHGKTSNVACSPQWLSGPLRVSYEDQRMTYLTRAHRNEISIPTVLELSVMQIESSLLPKATTNFVYHYVFISPQFPLWHLRLSVTTATCTHFGVNSERARMLAR